ncbi:MAG: hypothetical protein DMG00_24355 [Acidobacteria bacterium]|nr:MAG: hypothetical protein DMG00_24355 [Acidobacteriota bacterium]
MRRLAGVLLSAVLLAAAAASVSAQQFTGGVRGEVRDPNGVIPGVTVTLTNEATNISRDTVTNEVGQYNFPAVPPGTYTLKTQLTGYKTYESKGLTVGTQQFITLDVVLQVGALEESITVTGQSPLINTANASHAASLDREALEALPAPGRNAFMIGVTVPTVMPVGDPQFNRQQDQTNASRLSLGGGGIRANNYLIDGVPITELRGRAVLNPTIEALEEVKVQVHTYDAEMGRTGGGVFNVTAKSGTNNYHGSGSMRKPVSVRRRPAFPTRTTACTAAASADRSSRTGRFSGSPPKDIDRARRATSRKSGRRRISATATSPTPP